MSPLLGLDLGQMAQYPNGMEPFLPKQEDTEREGIKKKVMELITGQSMEDTE